MKIYKIFHAISLLLILISSFAQAQVDEIPTKKLSSGKPETTLCGIKLNVSDVKNEISKIQKRFGLPVKVEYMDEAQGSEYLFKKNFLDLYIRATNQSVYMISISGKDTEKECSTGAGLKLGDDVSQIKKIYGNYLKKFDVESNNPYIRVGWKKEWAFELSMTLDKKGRVDYISLDCMRAIF